jgi:hypothetical protein
MLERRVDGLMVADGGAIGRATVPVVRLMYNSDGLRRSRSSRSRVPRRSAGADVMRASAVLLTAQGGRGTDEG